MKTSSHRLLRRGDVVQIISIAVSAAAAVLSMIISADALPESFVFHSSLSAVRNGIRKEMLLTLPNLIMAGILAFETVFFTLLNIISAAKEGRSFKSALSVISPISLLTASVWCVITFSNFSSYSAYLSTSAEDCSIIQKAVLLNEISEDADEKQIKTAVFSDFDIVTDAAYYISDHGSEPAFYSYISGYDSVSGKQLRFPISDSDASVIDEKLSRYVYGKWEMTVNYYSRSQLIQGYSLIGLPLDLEEATDEEIEKFFPKLTITMNGLILNRPEDIDPMYGELGWKITKNGEVISRNGSGEYSCAANDSYAHLDITRKDKKGLHGKLGEYHEAGDYTAQLVMVRRVTATDTSPYRVYTIPISNTLEYTITDASELESDHFELEKQSDRAIISKGDYTYIVKLFWSVTCDGETYLREFDPDSPYIDHPEKLGSAKKEVSIALAGATESGETVTISNALTFEVTTPDEQAEAAQRNAQAADLTENIAQLINVRDSTGLTKLFSMSVQDGTQEQFEALFKRLDSENIGSLYDIEILSADKFQCEVPFSGTVLSLKASCRAEGCEGVCTLTAKLCTESPDDGMKGIYSLVFTFGSDSASFGQI